MVNRTTRLCLVRKMHHGVSLPHSIQEGMRRLPARRVGRSSIGFRPAPRRNRHLCCVLINTVGYNFLGKKFFRDRRTHTGGQGERLTGWKSFWGVGDPARRVALGAGKLPFSGSAPRALKLSLCEHLSGIGTDKHHAEAEPGTTLSLRGAPVPQSAGTEARAGIVPASTPENSIGHCGWPPGIDVARKSWCGAVAAPLPDVAEHVVQPQGVAVVAADGCRFPQERPLGSTVARTPTVEVRLGTSQAVAERRGGICPGAAGIFPLGLGGQINGQGFALC